MEEGSEFKAIRDNMMKPYGGVIATRNDEAI
jgi:hypothetical protein